MDNWEFVDDNEKHGIVIYNYYQDAPFRIKLTVGERVSILEKNGDWYLGHSTTNSGFVGIFPKSYIYLKNPTLDNCGLGKDGRSGFIEEITTVIREWGQIWKQFFVENNSNVNKIRRMINMLTLYRSKILSGMLPKYHLQELKENVVSIIDSGNKMLGLDMVVRDKKGDILNPDETSTMKLYMQHELTAERIRQPVISADPIKNFTEEITHYSHTLFVSVMNFVCILEEDVELIMVLYDYLKGHPITENFVFLWRKDGHILETAKLKVLFTGLNGKDLKKEQIYLVCYAVKIGDAEDRECEYRSSLRENHKILTDEKKHKTKEKKKCKRRPFGVAATDVTTFLNVAAEDYEEMHLFLPFLRWTQGDLHSLLKSLILLKETAMKECIGQGLWVLVKLFHGDIKEVYHMNQYLMAETTVSARKLGFPEIIFPSNVRNELYLTLVEGEFHRVAIAPDRNVEVAVCVCNENGLTISEVIMIGAGIEYLSEYRSVIYYREKKPKWMETFKINIPYSDFKGCHLKFTFTHRPASNAAVKSFAMSYINIMQDDGTTLSDGKHSLFVYKIDHNKVENGDNMYLKLPAETKDSHEQKLQIKGFSVNAKDKFTIQTYVCSTKLTQNLNLLKLLDWMNNPEFLLESLSGLFKVDGNDIVKFLQDILDALFSILVKSSDCDTYDGIIFDSLLYVFGMVSKTKYKHFQPVLDLYIQEHFCATLAYRKLITILKKHLENIDLSDEESLLNVMVSLQYFIKCIVRSRQLFSELYQRTDEEDVEISLRDILINITELLCCNTELDAEKQRKLLIHLYSIFPEVLEVFNSKTLSSACLDQCIMLTAVIKKHDSNCIKANILMMHDIVHSKIFLLTDCRNVIMPVIIEKTIEHLVNFEEVELCLNCLSDVLELIFELGLESSVYDDSEIMLKVLRNVIQTIVCVDRNLNLTDKLVALMISILRTMKLEYFKQYINYFTDKHQLLDFLMEMLILFEELVSRSVYPSDWCEMILLQNRVILKTIRGISIIIRSEFLHSFEWQIWNNYFHSAIAFIKQPFLQLENFSEKKRSHITTNYKDMRREIGYDIKSMWFALGHYKMQFIPDLVGPFLDMSVISDTELRKTTFHIFFDMAQCEFFNSTRLKKDISQSKDPGKSNFPKFEKELTNKIDILIEGGRGDMYYKEQFYNILYGLFEKHVLMKEEGIRFVTKVKRQLERLLIYRIYVNDDNKENAMICTYNLLDFYCEINQKETYARYVNKLCELHLQCGNYIEAALTLNLYCELFDWSDNILSPTLVSDRYSQCHTNFDLKECLYYDIIDYLDKGKMWSYALGLCKDLCLVYENEVHDYLKLSNILMKMSEFYDSIMNNILPEIEYFCVVYYGKGFPSFLQNKMFIYRGNKYEKLDDFYSRIQSQFPKAKFIDEPARDDARESPFQYLQIHKIFPVFDENNKLLNLPLRGEILHHLLEYDVQKFSFSVPIKNIETAPSSSGESLLTKPWQIRTVLVSSMAFPGVLKLFPVISSNSYKISPIQTIIDEIKRNNRSLYSILPFRNSAFLNMNHVLLKLKEIVEGSIILDVNKGLKAFVADYYEYTDLLNKLKALLVEQMALMEVFIQQLGTEAPSSLKDFMKQLQYCASELPVNIDKCNSVFCKKVMEDSKGNDSLPKTLLKRIKSLKRKSSFLKKNRLPYEFSELQNSKSHWYIPSPVPATSASVSTLSSLNFTTELDNASTVSPSHFAGFCNSSQEMLDVQPLESHDASNFMTKVNKEMTFEKDAQSEDEMDGSLYFNSKMFDFDEIANKISGLSNQTHSASVLDDNIDEPSRRSVGKTPDNEIDDAPPPLPPKERDYINLVDGMDSECWPIGMPQKPITNKPLPPEPMEIQPPPVHKKSKKKCPM